MQQYLQTVTGVATGTPVMIDANSVPCNIGFGCVITGTATYTVQHTFDDLQGSHGPAITAGAATWFNHPFVAAATTNQDGNYAYPVRAIRLNVTVSTGSVKLTALQGI